jgi:hypothetical protein
MLWWTHIAYFLAESCRYDLKKWGYKSGIVMMLIFALGAFLLFGCQ